MDTDANCFCVLLAEDDAISRAFFVDSLQSGGADVTACADGDAALHFARSRSWNLLIVDQHLPGRSGSEVLVALRADPDAASHTAPIVATSAADDVEANALLGMGFAEVLLKPTAVATLHALLVRHGCGSGAPLDDRDALRACGSAATVRRLRWLLAEQELPRIQNELDGAHDDPHALGPVLHRLRASCGFCGARALGRASAALQGALAASADRDEIQMALLAFRRALTETRASLRADSDPGA